MAQHGPSKFCGEGLMLRAERTWRERYLRVTRVTPRTFYPEWMVQVAHQGAGRLRFMVALAAPLPGTTYAGTRWTTLGYPEKVRSQVLSLRQIPRADVFSGRTRSQFSPVIVPVFRLSHGHPIGRVGLLFSETQLLSEALDSTDSIRFSKFQRFEPLMNREKKGSAVSLGQPRYPMA
jgi:hypothetical protein